MLHYVSVVLDGATLGCMIVRSYGPQELIEKVMKHVPKDQELIGSMAIIGIGEDEIKEMVVDQWYTAEDARRMGMKTEAQYIAENN